MSTNCGWQERDGTKSGVSSSMRDLVKQVIVRKVTEFEKINILLNRAVDKTIMEDGFNGKFGLASLPVRVSQEFGKTR